jgi:hypothetical protein
MNSKRNKHNRRRIDYSSRLIRLSLALCSILFFGIMTDIASAATCGGRFRFCDNCDSHVTFYTKKNTACRQPYSIAGGRGGVFSQKVIKRPRGLYGTANTTSGAYQPPPGYIGEDYFEVQIEYERSGTRYTTILKVTAEISE